MTAQLDELAAWEAPERDWGADLDERIDALEAAWRCARQDEDLVTSFVELEAASSGAALVAELAGAWVCTLRARA